MVTTCDLICDKLVTRINPSDRQYRLVIVKPPSYDYEFELISVVALDARHLYRYFVFPDYVRIRSGKSEQFSGELAHFRQAL